VATWAAHIKGAVALLELRGIEQLQTRTGLSLYLQLRFQVVSRPYIVIISNSLLQLLGCIQRREYVPYPILEWSEEARKYQNEEQLPRSYLAEILGRLCTFRAMLKDGSIIDTQEILSSAKALDNDLILWSENLCEDWLYSDIVWSREDPLVYERHCHLYSSFCAATTWNTYRCARVMMNEIMLNQLDTLMWSLSPSPECDIAVLQETCSSTIMQMTSDICASVFYHLTHDGITLELNCTPPIGGGAFLIWPLWVAANDKRTSCPLRLWVREKIYLLGHAMGIKNALRMSDHLSKLYGPLKQ
jgi:hypothetical protein